MNFNQTVSFVQGFNTHVADNSFMPTRGYKGEGATAARRIICHRQINGTNDPCNIPFITVHDVERTQMLVALIEEYNRQVSATSYDQPMPRANLA